MLKLGDQSISALRLGGTEIKKAYLGEAVVFAVTEPPAPVYYTVSASIDPAGSGTVTGAGTYPEGQTVTLTAAPGDGYAFAGWQEGGAAVSGSASYTFTVTGDRALTAVFEAVSRLPAGYTEVEYIYPLNVLSQINTNTIAACAGVNVELNLYLNEDTIGSYYFSFFKCIKASSIYYGYILGRLTTTNYAWFYSGNSVNSDNTAKYTIGADKSSGEKNFKLLYSEQTDSTKKVWFNDIQKSINCLGSVANVFGLSTAKAYLGGPIYSSSAYSLASGLIRYKSVKISNTSHPDDSSYNAELVPCKNPSGVVGMYDLVKGAFCQHVDATYKWGAGPEV